MVALGCSPLSVVGYACTYTEDRDAFLALGDATLARIIARAGKLEVQGHYGLEVIRVRGEACASARKALDQIELVTSRQGSEILIEAKIPDGRLFSRASLDLEIDVPATLALHIRDSSGEVKIHNAGALHMKDCSGGIVIEGIAGEVFVDDGSGSTRISDVRGNVALEDGSGDVSVTAIGGDVTLRDGSGDVKIERVEGDVTVTQDGSGDISASHVEGSFTVENDGSGDVRHEDIRGRVSVRD
jgi:hypothetical protein